MALGGSRVQPRSYPDGASAPREESRTLTGKRRGRQGRHGLLPCCGQLRDACVLVGASCPGWAQGSQAGVGAAPLSSVAILCGIS